jgi:hypothetical protein
MGLDQYAGRYTWRKHARLQQFMNEMWHKQNPNGKTDDGMNLGFNGGDKPVIIDKNVIKALEVAIKSDFFEYFCHDGFFWGQQFQEESVKRYKKQDKQFLKEAKQAIKDGKPLKYECSW